MIKLEKNTTNRVVVTATENVTLTGTVSFLFEFISDDTFTKKYFISEDISPNTCRYNEFELTITDGVEDVLNGVINLSPNGYYKYNIYQQDNNTNLDPNLSDGIVENGKMYLIGEEKPIQISYTASNDKTYIAYE